jgi:glycosyltransferase involved in cell wall biosynthesis
VKLAEGCVEIMTGRARSAFVACLVGSARRATRSRRQAGTLRSLWGTTPIINLISMSRADRLLGIEAETVVSTTYYVTDDFDVNLGEPRQWLEREKPDLVSAFHWLVFAWAMLRYDVFNYFNDRGLLVPTGGYGSDLGVNLEEMRCLRLAGKRLYTFAYGADYRTRRKTLEGGPYNFCMHCPEIGRYCVCDDVGGARMLATIAKHATAMVATGLATDQVPRPVELAYLVVDTKRLVPGVVRAERPRGLRVVHVPNHPHFKGTRYLEEAVERLRARGRSIELVMATGVPNERAIEMLRSADVVADQFIGGSFGYLAVEAMALGKPVLAFLRDPSRVPAPEECPIVNTDPGSLEATLEHLIDHAWVLRDLGRRSRQYVERYLSVPALAERLRHLHLTFDRPGWAVYRRLAPTGRATPWGFVAIRAGGRVRRARHRYAVARVVVAAARGLLRAGVRTARAGRRAIGAGLRSLINVLATPAYWRVLAPRPAGRGPTSGEVVMLVVSEVRRDPRVEREARALADAGFRVKVIYPDAYSPRFDEAPIDWGPGISFRPAPAGAGAFVAVFPWLWGGPLHRMALQERPFAFHAHDLSTALASLSAARKTGARCVVDFHEWFSENVYWSPLRGRWRPHPWWRRIVFRSIERLVMRRADRIVTVCDEIARQLSEVVCRPRHPVAVVRNVPRFDARPTREYPSLKEALGIPTERFVLLYQGGVGPTRFLEPVIEALRYAPGVIFVVRGPGTERAGPEYRRLAKAAGVEDRLVVLPAVPSSDVVAAAKGADAGVWTLPNWCKNFYYALPNKIFEYLAAGVPVVAARFPEAQRLVEGHEVGVCFDPYSPPSIGAALQSLVEDAGRLERCRENIPGALAALQADREWERLVAVYRAMAQDAGLVLGPARPRT